MLIGQQVLVRSFSTNQMSMRKPFESARDLHGDSTFIFLILKLHYLWSKVLTIMAEYPNFELNLEMELESSQTSDLGQEQLDEIEGKAQAKNTKRATEWGLNKFYKWSEKRKINVDLKTIAPKELNEVLRKFYAEVKTEKGQPLTPSAMTGIRPALHRHLTSAPLSRDVNILQDSDFMSANKMFEARAKFFTKEMNVKPKHKQSIDSGDMEKLNKYFIESQNKDGVWTDPEKLTEFVWFSLCYHFGRRGREGWRELNKHSFEIKTDDVGARYVTEKLTEQTNSSYVRPGF